MNRPVARTIRGFRDLFAKDLLNKERLLGQIKGVYERHGFVPLETPALEFVDVLGKFLPESHLPDSGIFSFRNPDEARMVDPNAPDLWVGLRYDLTAPLARVVAQHEDLQRPFRRYQVGPVWRYEKPGVGRFREFTQFDFDSVGVPSVAADAEACAVISDVFLAVGFSSEEYEVRVNHRKVLQGVLESAGLAETEVGESSSQAGIALRAIDKFDRLGIEGVISLLGDGRIDASGDATEGARLGSSQIDVIVKYLTLEGTSRSVLCDGLSELVGSSATGRAGLADLRAMDRLLGELGLSDDQVRFEPTVVRGLAYYTGPVFEGVVTKQASSLSDGANAIGAVFGGGRYDDLVERFTGKKVPATGASVGVDRLLEILKLLGRAEDRRATAQVLVAVMDSSLVGRAFGVAESLRSAQVNAEVYLGEGRIGQQIKYADKMGIALVVILGGDEIQRGVVQIKDLELGRELSKKVSERSEWRGERPAQREVRIEEMVRTVLTMLGRA